VVWVRKGRGPCSERVRVIGSGAPLLIPGEMVPLDWPEDDLVAEIRPTRAQHV
jgi:hypothetical protein